MNLVRFGLVVMVQLRLEEREGEIIVGGLISLRVPVSCARNSYFILFLLVYSLSSLLVNERIIGR